jgi:hypothetical protein
LNSAEQDGEGFFHALLRLYMIALHIVINTKHGFFHALINKARFHFVPVRFLSIDAELAGSKDLVFFFVEVFWSEIVNNAL